MHLLLLTDFLSLHKTEIVPEAEVLSSSSVGEVPYTLGSTNGVKEALEPPPLPTPYCRLQESYRSVQSVTGLLMVCQFWENWMKQVTVEIKETKGVVSGDL